MLFRSGVFNNLTTTTYLDMMGCDWIATIEYQITSKGCKQTRDYPAEGPEFYVERIWLSQDFPKYAGPDWELNGEMLRLVSNLDHVTQTIIDDIGDYLASDD